MKRSEIATSMFDKSNEKGSILLNITFSWDIRNYHSFSERCETYTAYTFDIFLHSTFSQIYKLSKLWNLYLLFSKLVVG